MSTNTQQSFSLEIIFIDCVIQNQIEKKRVFKCKLNFNIHGAKSNLRINTN